MKKNWSDILDALRHMLPEGKFKIFLEPLKGRLVKLASERESAQGLLVAAPTYEWELRLTAANEFMASQVRDQFTQAIAEAGRLVLGSAPKLVVNASTARAKAEMPKPVNAEELAKSIPTAPGVLVSRGRQLDLPIGLPACAPSIRPALCTASNIPSTISWSAPATSLLTPPPPISSTPVPLWKWCS